MIQYKNILNLSKCLAKSATVRPIIAEIINLPFIQSTMQEFVISGGKQSYISINKNLYQVSHEHDEEEENEIIPKNESVLHVLND